MQYSLIIKSHQLPGFQAKLYFISRLMQGLKKANIDIDRKMLADLAIADSAAFSQIVDKAKASLA